MDWEALDVSLSEFLDKAHSREVGTVVEPHSCWLWGLLALDDLIILQQQTYGQATQEWEEKFSTPLLSLAGGL